MSSNEIAVVSKAVGAGVLGGIKKAIEGPDQDNPELARQRHQALAELAERVREALAINPNLQIPGNFDGCSLQTIKEAIHAIERYKAAKILG